MPFPDSAKLPIVPDGSNTVAMSPPVWPRKPSRIPDSAAALVPTADAESKLSNCQRIRRLGRSYLGRWHTRCRSCRPRKWRRCGCRWRRRCRNCRPRRWRRYRCRWRRRCRTRTGRSPPRRSGGGEAVSAGGDREVAGTIPVSASALPDWNSENPSNEMDRSSPGMSVAGTGRSGTTGTGSPALSVRRQRSRPSRCRCPARRPEWRAVHSFSVAHWTSFPWMRP